MTHDPRWLNARFKSCCKDCNSIINKGDRIFYYPKGKHVYCEFCGKIHFNDFQNCVEMEAFC
ncbi:MAG: hypothetical protein GY853_15885 [PVC group bacterium]|nr:hypothetical protein [PVC group bacterium]